MASDNHSRSAVHLSFSERKKTNKEATLSERFAPPPPRRRSVSSAQVPQRGALLAGERLHGSVRQPRRDPQERVSFH